MALITANIPTPLYQCQSRCLWHQLLGADITTLLHPLAILVLCLALQSPVHFSLVLLISSLLCHAPVSIMCVQNSSGNTDTVGSRLHVSPTEPVVLLPLIKMPEQSSCGSQESNRQREGCLKAVALEITMKSKHAQRSSCYSLCQGTMFDTSRGSAPLSTARWVLVRAEKETLALNSSVMIALRCLVKKV